MGGDGFISKPGQVFLDREGRIDYRHSDDGAELERMDYLELIARVTCHIPDKGQVMVRYYGLYANAHRGKVRKAGRVPVVLSKKPSRIAGPCCKMPFGK